MVKEVFVKVFCGDFLFEIVICCCDLMYVVGDGVVVVDVFEFFFLEYM